MKKFTGYLRLCHMFLTSVLLAGTSNFSKLRNNHDSDDFTLISKIDGGQHTCIKKVLCKNSKYFNSAIMGGFRESTKNTMTLDYSSETIKIILDFVYDQTRQFFYQLALPLNIYCELLAFSDYGFVNNLKMALSEVLVSFSLDQEHLNFAVETIEIQRNQNLLTQVLAKIYDALDKNSFEIDNSWIIHLMGLDFEYNPEKQKLDTDSVTRDFYLALRHKANELGLINLNQALDKIAIQLEPEEIIPTLREGVARKDFKLLLIALQCARNQSKPNEELINVILDEIEKENPLMVNGLKRIRFSQLWDCLWSNHKAILIDKFLTALVADATHVLSMAAWSKDEIKHALAQYESIEAELIHNFENHVLNYALGMDLQTAAQFTSFILGYIPVYMSAAGGPAYKAAHDVADMTAGHAATKVVYKAAKNAAGNALYKAAFSAATNAAFGTAVNAAHCAAFKAAHHAAYEAAKKAAQDAIGIALPKMELNDPQEIGRASYKLSNLFVLAYVAQAEYHEQYFDRSYSASLNVLQNDTSFNSSIDEVMDIVAYNICNNAEVPTQNPFIISWRNILETIRPNDDGMVIMQTGDK